MTENRMTNARMTEAEWLLLQAYHDGELSWLGRWRAERLLRRDDAARAHLDEWTQIGSLLREEEAEAASPDLWAAIRAELPRTPIRPVEAVEAFTESRGWLRWGAPLAAAAAGAAVALTLMLQPGDVATGPSIRWLDSGNRSAMVLQDDREATIIWVLESQGAGSQGGNGAVL